MPRLHRVGRVWYAAFYDANGTRHRKSTRCTDRRAAEAIARRWEREAADPTHTAAKAYRLETALQDMLADREARGRSSSTLDFYRAKAGHLGRVLGLDTTLATIDAPAVDDYIAIRRSEGAGQHTITKELTTLRIALKLAIRAGLYQRPLETVMPVTWESGYQPGSLVLTPEQADRLIWSCVPHRGEWLAFILGTGARASEAESARPEDVDLARGLVRLRGTKTERARREVPLLPWSRRYVEAVTLPLTTFGSNLRHRYMSRACRRAGVPYTTANDLRRTAASWLRERVGDSSLVAVYLGHADGRMAERTYAQLRRSDALMAAIESRTHVGQQAGEKRDDTEHADP